MPLPIRNRKGFTLIELLTVIAIIGILAAVLFPGVQGVMKAAKRSAAATKLSNIGKAYVNFNNSGSGGKFINYNSAWALATPTAAQSIFDYAAVLAFNVDLNQAELWYVDADPANENATFPKQVLTGLVGAQKINTSMSQESSANGYVSWSAYSPVAKNINADTPLVWSRGLSTAGAWDATKGVWGSEGGHVTFGDGHVVWLSNTSDTANQFTSRKTIGSTTANWQEAVATSGTSNELKSAY